MKLFRSHCEGGKLKSLIWDPYETELVGMNMPTFQSFYISNELSSILIGQTAEAHIQKFSNPTEQEETGNPARIWS